MSDYDILFLGYPIWWGKAPKIISTFLESYDLSGKTVIPGSSNPDHIRENISIFDFALTDAEMAEINALDRNEKHDWY